MFDAIDCWLVPERSSLHWCQQTSIGDLWNDAEHNKLLCTENYLSSVRLARTDLVIKTDHERSPGFLCFLPISVFCWSVGQTGGLYYYGHLTLAWHITLSLQSRIFWSFRSVVCASYNILLILWSWQAFNDVLSAKNVTESIKSNGSKYILTWKRRRRSTG